jgi:hypothetical protein
MRFFSPKWNTQEGYEPNQTPPPMGSYDSALSPHSMLPRTHHAKWNLLKWETGQNVTREQFRFHSSLPHTEA